MDLGKKTNKCHSHAPHITLSVYINHMPFIVDADAGHLAMAVPGTLLHCQATLLSHLPPLFSPLCSSEGHHYVQPTLRSGRACPIHLWAYLHKLCGILLQGKIASSPPFIYSTCLYQYRFMEIYFVLGALIQYYHNKETLKVERRFIPIHWPKQTCHLLTPGWAKRLQVEQSGCHVCLGDGDAEALRDIPFIPSWEQDGENGDTHPPSFQGTFPLHLW